MEMSVSARATLFRFAAGGLAVVAAQPVVAQAIDHSAASAPADDIQLKDIVVTAQRRSENLQNVPISVSAFSGASLARLNIRDTQQIQALTPGLTFASDAGASQISIRGVGTGYSGPGLEGSVALYVDDSYFVTQTGAILSLLDVSQVQVLKGPQGTLYGRNATGGAIVISTTDPIIGANSGHISAGLGTHSYKEAEGVLNLALGSNVAARFAGRYEHRGGYVRNLFTGDRIGKYDRFDGRAKLAWQPSSGFKAIAKVEYTRDKGDDQLRQQRLTGALCGGCVLTGAVPATGFYTTQQSAPLDPPLSETYLGSLRLSYDAGSVALSSTTAYRSVTVIGCVDQDSEPAQLLEVCNDLGGRRDHSFTQELRAASTFRGPLNFTVGAFYEKDHNRYPLSIFGAVFGPLKPLFDNRDHLNAWSIFAEAYYEIMPKLKVTLGGRYSEDRKRHSFSNNPDAQLVFGASSNEVQGKFTNFTPRAVLAYQTGATNFYASFNRGFKSGGFNSPAANTQPVIKPETITSYEVGAKTHFAHGHGRLELSAFHYNWKNLQVAYIDAATGGLVQQNAAAAKNDGIEGTISLLPTKGLNINLSGIYMHSRYSSFPAAAVFFPNVVTGVGLINGAEDVRGFPTPRAPKFSGSAQIGYDMETASGWKVALSALYRYSGQYDFSAGAGGPVRFERQKAYGLLNLSATVTPRGDRFSVTAFADNVTQSHYANIRTTTNLGGYESAAQPRLVGMRGSYKF